MCLYFIMNNETKKFVYFASYLKILPVRSVLASILKPFSFLLEQRDRVKFHFLLQSLTLAAERSKYTTSII